MNREDWVRLGGHVLPVRPCNQRRERGVVPRLDHFAIAATENEVRAVPHDVIAAFMQQAMMVPTQRDEVVEPRRAAVGPMLDVVAIDKARVRAAWESTPVSRRRSARCSAGGITRVLRPTLSTWPSPLSRMRTIALSHAIRRTVSEVQ